MTANGTIPVSHFNSEHDNRPARVDLTWAELAALLGPEGVRRGTCTLATCAGKTCPHKFGPAWSPTIFEGGKSDTDAVGVSLLGLDMDHLGDEQLRAAVEKLAPYKYIAHATHSDRPGDRCVRVIVALSRPVAVEEWPRFRPAAVAAVGTGVDPSTNNIGRIYFLPSRPSDADYLYTTNDGIPLDVDAVLATAPAVEARTATTPAADAPRGDFGPASPALLAHVKERLRQHGPSIRGEGGDKHAYEVGAILFNDYALTDEEALPLAFAWNSMFPENEWTTEKLITKVRNGERYAKGRYGEARKSWELAQFIEGLAGAGPFSESGVRSGETDAPRIYGGDLRDFLGEDDPGDDEDAWLIRGILAAGVPEMIVGDPKSRKTFMLIHQAICIAAGLDWLGKFKTTRGRALLLLREDSLRESRRRLWRLSRGLGLDPRDLGEALRVDVRTPFYFQSREDVDAMRRTIETFQPTFIGIDSLSRTHHGDENSKKEMSAVTSTWGDLCQEYGVAIGLIHHMTKSGEGPLMKRIRGTGDLGALIRHAVGVEKKDGTCSELEFDGNLAGLPEPFVVEMRDGFTPDRKPCIRIEHKGSALEARTQSIDEGILKALRVAAPGGLNATELEREVEGKGTAIRKRRDALVERGRIEKIGTRYHLARL